MCLGLLIVTKTSVRATLRRQDINNNNNNNNNLPASAPTPRRLQVETHGTAVGTPHSSQNLWAPTAPPSHINRFFASPGGRDVRTVPPCLYATGSRIVGKVKRKWPALKRRSGLGLESSCFLLQNVRALATVETSRSFFFSRVKCKKALGLALGQN